MLVFVHTGGHKYSINIRSITSFLKQYTDLSLKTVDPLINTKG